MTENLQQILEAQKIYEVLNKNRDKIVCRFVGGCVRDQILEVEIKDIDMATSLTPDEVSTILKEQNIKFNDENRGYGLISAFIGKFKFEITTLRKDINQSGRQTDVIFTTDWKQDALRRDFTINSIYYDHNNYIDPFNGIADLKNGKVRFISDPDQKIKEDYLRALRYFRFFSIYSKCEHEEIVLKSVAKHEIGISGLSNERKIQELSKILVGGNPYKLFNNKFCLDFFSYIYKGLKYFERLNFAKNNKTIDSSFDYIILLALLLIDKTENYLKFVKEFNLSNKIRNRFENIQKNFTYDFSISNEDIDAVEKKAINMPLIFIKDYIQFQYLVNNNYDYNDYKRKYNSLKNRESDEFIFDKLLFQSKGIKDEEKLKKVYSFLKHRWQSNNNIISEKDIEDAIEIYK